MNSNYMKTAFIDVMMWQWQYLAAVTEFKGSSDILGIKKNFYVSEFEIKVSKADLKNEVKAIKNALNDTNDDRFKLRSSTKEYKHSRYIGSLSHWKGYRPNDFSFVVTKDLEVFAIEILSEFITYGLYSVEKTYYGGKVNVIRSPKKLHTDKFDDNGMVYSFLRKLSYESNNLRKKIYYTEVKNES